MGSLPHIYLSNIFDEKEQFSTYGERYDWNNYPTLSFYNIFLIMGSMPHIYLSNIFDEKEQFSTYGERYDWNNYPTLSFYDIYIKPNNEIIPLNKYDRSAVFNFNFDLIRANGYIKTFLVKNFF